MIAASSPRPAQAARNKGLAARPLAPEPWRRVAWLVITLGAALLLAVPGLRPLEALLASALVLAFVALAIPSLGAPRGFRYAAALITPLLAAAQTLMEGPRWQMIPAYALSGVLCVLWFVRGNEQVWPPHIVARLAVGLGVLWLAVSVVLPVIVPVFRLPRPTGPYAVGTLTYHLVDAARPEIFSQHPNDARELMVQIWYPAEADRSAPRAPYIQDTELLAPALAGFLRLPEFTFSYLKYISSNAIPSAPVADDQPSYPVLILPGGLGGYRQAMSFQVEELASHGYIVAAIDQPYAATLVVFPDGRQVAFDTRMEPPHRQAGYDPNTAPAHSSFVDAHVPYLAQDVVLTLDRLTALNQTDPNNVLTGRLDLQRTGLIGLSLGGIVGGEACLLEPRLRACLLEDAYMHADVVERGLRVPTMWITRDADTMRLERRRSGGWAEAAIAEHLTTMRAVYQHLPGDGYYVQVTGMFHVDMTDAPLLTPLAAWFGFGGPIGVQRAHAIVNAYSVGFFDRHLKDRPAPLLDGSAEEFTNVVFETRRPA